MRFLLATVLLLCSTPALSQKLSTTTNNGTGSNSEMTAMFNADQLAREHPATVDWKILRPADENRRKRTQELLASNSLITAEDFYHAAYIFQHGDTADDCLKAHSLAVVAVAKGKPEAVKIASNTLDRYLQRIGQPQIYGTQFLHPPGERWTQEPYHRDLIPDTVREASGVAPLKDQEGQREYWQRELP